MKFYKDQEGNIYFKCRDGHTDSLLNWITGEYCCEFDSEEADNMTEMRTLYLARYDGTSITVDKYPVEEFKRTLCIYWGENGVTHILESNLKDYCKSTECMALDYNRAKEGLYKKLNKTIEKHTNWINRVRIAMGKVD